MDQSSLIADNIRSSHAGAGRAATGPVLSLVPSRFQLAEPADPAPQTWGDSLAQLLGWLGVETEFVAPARAHRLARMTDWATAASHRAPSAPVFAPWIGWSPAAFQHGGIAGLPDAQYVASYLIDHARGAASAQGAVDIVLMSPHPSVCIAEAAGVIPAPRADVLRAMIRAARNEGRARAAIICHARQRNAVARHLLAAGKGLTRDGFALDLLTLEDALVPLMAGTGRWDAIIAMPDLRSTVFTMLSETSGVRRAWPMLWHGPGLKLITSETPGEGASRLPLDGPALIHALTLTLHAAGAGRAAARLHEGWSRLRDSGVTSIGRGSDAPYVSAVSDADFVAMLCRDAAVSKRPPHVWRALGQPDAAQTATGRAHNAPLRVVASNAARTSPTKGR